MPPRELLLHALRLALLRFATPRIEARLAALSREMGLQSAEVIVFPRSRRAQAAPLLGLAFRNRPNKAAHKPSRPVREVR